MPTSTPSSAWLVPLAGPPLEPIQLLPTAAGLTLGRHEECDLQLPAEADKVSRRHARFVQVGGQWRISDLGSRWGTFVNGQALSAGREMPLAEGDLIRIEPWTFCWSSSPAERQGVPSVDDTTTSLTLVRSLGVEQAPKLADDLMALLLECASGIHAASDEKALAEVVLDAACRCTGLANAALLRPVDSSGRIEVIASRTVPGTSGALYSRSLLAVASTGQVAEFSPTGGADISQSIVQMSISAALCVPLMLGSTVAAYLYMDSRSAAGSTGRAAAPPRWAAAAGFCQVLGRMAGLALANLKRLEMEKRQAAMLAELAAGAEAQRWILPRRQATLGRFAYTGESRPGQYVGGDFFDVVLLDEARLIVAMGDVTGKGIPASVLMTATQGFLHASLAEHGQPARAVTELNRFIFPRRPDGRFVTLWVGLFDAAAGLLTYVDAGHGYAMLALAEGEVKMLSGEEGLPVGVASDAVYAAQSQPLPSAWRAVIVSDGIIEQFGVVADSAGRLIRRRFGVEGLRKCLSNSVLGQDLIADLFRAVTAHAGGEALADDATAVGVTPAGL